MLVLYEWGQAPLEAVKVDCTEAETLGMELRLLQAMAYEAMESSPDKEIESVGPNHVRVRPKDEPSDGEEQTPRTRNLTFQRHLK